MVGGTSQISARPDAIGTSTHTCLHVLRGFELRCGEQTLVIPLNAQRVLALLAVRGRPQLRVAVSTTLWMDTPQQRAAANLRTALWKVRQRRADVIRGAGAYLQLSPQVEIDLAVLVAQAKRLISCAESLDDGDTETGRLAGDLLPDWDEDWILFERERLRQLRMHALEALCRRLSDAGRHGEAIDAGLGAVTAEPLRESAQRALICAHLAEGNVSEAIRQYDAYRRLLWTELHIDPSAELRAMVSPQS
jgi:DNA-binding SARP family transcriptional activator